ncbi:MAG TPA: hypothetical protein VGE39_03575 [Prosthecobacter sp.]
MVIMQIWMLRFLLRRWYALMLRCGLFQGLSTVFPLWARSDAIYVGPAGPCATVYPECVALKRVIKTSSINDAEFYEHLSHRSPWVVGYCFEALIARNSPLLDSLPETLLNRTEQVTVGLGCMRCYLPLREHVKNRMERLSHADV